MEDSVIIQFNKVCAVLFFWFLIIHCSPVLTVSYPVKSRARANFMKEPLFSCTYSLIYTINKQYAVLLLLLLLTIHKRHLGWNIKGFYYILYIKLLLFLNDFNLLPLNIYFLSFGVVLLLFSTLGHNKKKNT